MIRFSSLGYILSVFLLGCAETNMPDQRLNKQSNSNAQIEYKVLFASITGLKLETKNNLLLNYGIFNSNSSENGRPLESGQLSVILHSDNKSGKVILGLGHDGQVVTFHHDIQSMNQSYEYVVRNCSVRTLMRTLDQNNEKFEFLMRLYPSARLSQKDLRAGVSVLFTIVKEDKNYMFKSYKLVKEAFLNDPKDLDFDLEQQSFSTSENFSFY